MLSLIELLIIMMCCFFFFTVTLKTLSTKTDPDRSASTENETRMIQEMHRGFMRMDERIIALETILMERDQQRVKEREIF